MAAGKMHLFEVAAASVAIDSGGRAVAFVDTDHAFKIRRPDAGLDVYSSVARGLHSARPAAGQPGRVYIETDTGVTYEDNGTNWLALGEGVILKAADETVNNSTTLQNDDHFAFPIDANAKWFFQLILDVVGVSVNADLKLDWSLPASATYKAQRGTQAAGDVASATPTALATAAFASGLLNGENMIQVLGWITAGASAGTATLQWAQNTLTAENVVVKAGSLMRLRQIL